jgi:RimJ/RimL family protein N-acetyltransferase
LRSLVFWIFVLSHTFCFGTLETERLRLRTWHDGDVPTIYEMVQDPEVSHYLKHVHFDEYSVLQKVAERANKNIEEKGFGYFVCELKSTGEVIGLIGLNYIDLDAPPFPCYTVSWILGKRYWKNGYAKEAAQKLLTFGFEHCKIPRVFACTAIGHLSSRRVMERLGMQLVGMFHFPGIEVNHPLSQQVLYEAVKSDSVH